MDTRRLQTELLVHAGRLQLEYNESTGAIHRVLTATARALTDEPCHVAVSYSSVAVSLAGEAQVLMPVRELRYNTAVQARVRASESACLTFGPASRWSVFLVLPGCRRSPVIPSGPPQSPPPLP